MTGGAPQSFDALVIGEALIDIVEHTGRPNAAAEHIGGSPSNVAMGLARLGHRALLATRVGQDPRGDRIRDALELEGVNFTSTSLEGDRTSTARATIDTTGAASYDFDIDWRFDSPAESTAVVHAGSIALFLEPGGTSVERYLAQLPPEAIVTIDPNVRPDLMPDHATALARFGRVSARAQLVKLSDEDAEWFFPGRSPIDIARQILSYGPRVVVVTLGAAGALAVTSKRDYAIPAAPASVVDTISAGDSFMAALVSSLLTLGLTGVEAHIEAVLDRAARAAAIAVSRAGANPPFSAALDGARS